MPKAKPFEIIAAQFHISGESAKYFLGRVQKSFKTEKPQQQLILDFMKSKKFKTLPEPHVVASMMYAGGVWVHALHVAPPATEDEPDIYF